MEMIGIEEGETVDKEGGEVVVDTGSQGLELDDVNEEEAPVVFKRQCAQKTSSRDAVQAVQGKSGSDGNNQPQVSADGWKGKQWSSDDDAERQAINLSANPGSWRHTALDLVKVVSGSKLDESEPSPPPPSQFRAWWTWKQASKMGQVDVHEEISESESANEHDTAETQSTTEVSKGIKQLQHNQTNTETSQSGAPPSKWAKTWHSAPVSQRSGSGAKNKYINTDLPPGCTNDNIWQRVFILSLADFTANFENPWNIPANKFKTILQLIWDVVYKNSIKHAVIIGRPVFYVAKQSLNNWQGGLVAVAVTIITAFFAQDPDFEDAKQHAEFATAMLMVNHFLFSQNKGLDYKGCGGHHLCYKCLPTTSTSFKAVLQSHN
ncbi:hypothetical protein PAXRUDRAFT_18845 [Paxillus rubicundulus Ve08.2h10]|uniref:Uncharacterized protein n=1 Tax=Paxillus rubicundulus Ve08.2h10 TaxID=930991 RepID=A0A0D0D676_9AGAM|nr:hypothetical protein PAXRUDRAFT_18845 [Paxillus rubicundulus Ve08.2h10]